MIDITIDLSKFVVSRMFMGSKEFDKRVEEATDKIADLWNDEVTRIMVSENVDQKDMLKSLTIEKNDTSDEIEYVMTGGDVRWEECEYGSVDMDATKPFMRAMIVAQSRAQAIFDEAFER